METEQIPFAEQPNFGLDQKEEEQKSSDLSEIEADDIPVFELKNNQLMIKKQKSDEFQQSEIALEFQKFIEFEWPAERYALLTLLIGLAYFFLGVFSIHFNLSLLMICGSIGFIMKSRILKAKKEGIINRLPGGLRNILLQRSLFDILCDLWYFPVITKYVKAILSPFIFKQSPEESLKAFEQLNPQFKKAITTKGLINILPHSLKEFLLPDDLLKIQEQPTLAIQSDHFETHSHKSTASENSEQSLNIQKSQNPNGLQTKIITSSQEVQNQMKRERLIKILKGTTQSDYDQLKKYQTLVQTTEKNSTLLTDPKTFILKFLTGSRNVSAEERTKLKRALLFAGLGLGTQLYFSKKTRKWLKVSMLFFLYAAATSVAAGSFILLSKHHKKTVSNPNQHHIINEENEDEEIPSNQQNNE